MAAKILCLSAILLGATVGACWPIADKNAVAGAQSAESPTADLGVADVALEIAINRFPAGYQGAGPSALVRAIRIPTAVPRLCRFKVG